MKKIPTLFVRKFENHKVVECTPEVTEGLEWVLLDTDVIPTIKYDGSCCMIDKYGHFYKRYDAKKGKKPPEGAIPCQEEADPITGHWPHWLPVRGDNPADRWFMEVFLNTKWDSIASQQGTYEAVGVHFQGNPYDLKNDYLVKHGEVPIHGLEMTYDGIKRWLAENKEEGIVFWHHGEPICKAKRSDFGFEWPIK